MMCMCLESRILAGINEIQEMIKLKKLKKKKFVCDLKMTK